MENLYIAYRLLEDFGIGKISRNDFESLYQTIKTRSDLTLRLAKVDMTVTIDNLETYFNANWTTINETEDLSDYGKLISLFTLFQLLVCKYKIVCDTKSISFLAFLFVERSSDIPWKDEMLVLRDKVHQTT